MRQEIKIPKIFIEAMWNFLSGATNFNLSSIIRNNTMKSKSKMATKADIKKAIKQDKKDDKKMIKAAMKKKK